MLSSELLAVAPEGPSWGEGPGRPCGVAKQRKGVALTFLGPLIQFSGYVNLNFPLTNDPSVSAGVA